MSETPIAFARWCLCGIETAIAFAGEKRAFLVQFSGAEVMQVSVVPCWGACSGVVGFNVAMLSHLVRDICRPARPGAGENAKKFALRHCSHRAGAKKFAQHTKNGSKWVVYGALGELLRGNAAGGVGRASFFAETRLGGAGRVLMQRGPGSWAHLLAPLTL